MENIGPIWNASQNTNESEVEWKHYLTSYVLKGRDDPSEHVKTNCVEIPEGIFNCIQNIQKETK